MQHLGGGAWSQERGTQKKRGFQRELDPPSPFISLYSHHLYPLNFSLLEREG